MEDKEKYYKLYNGEKILTPQALMQTKEWDDADFETKQEIASEYLADLRGAYLEEAKSRQSSTKEALDIWNEDAREVWENTERTWGEAIGDTVAGAARSILYPIPASAMTAYHGMASMQNRIFSSPVRLVEKVIGKDIGAGKMAGKVQESIDSAFPAGKVFNEKFAQLGDWANRKLSRTPEQEKIFDTAFKAFTDAAETHVIDRTPESFAAMKQAQEKVFDAAASMNDDGREEYGKRGVDVDKKSQNILSAYIMTHDPDMLNALKERFNSSHKLIAATEAIEAEKKKIIDEHGDGFLVREYANMLEFGDPSELAATAVEGALTFGIGKAAHAAAKGASVAAKGAKGISKAMSFSKRMKAASKAAALAGINTAFEAATEAWQTDIENPVARRIDYEKAAKDAAGQALLMSAIGGGVGAISAMNRRNAAKNAEIDNEVKRAFDQRNFERKQEKTVIDEEVPQTPTENLGYENAPVVEMPLEKLKLSEDVPNFKDGADPKTGVVEGQELQGSYERVGTAPIVVWERENGDMEVITGRHRLDLARRSGESTIPSFIVREKDGFTVEDAKIFDAESNIRDGMGDVRDYAHFFRNKPDIAEEDARNKGLLARAKGRVGWAIGKNASDDVYTLYRNGKISADRAAAIANGAPNDQQVQLAALESSEGMDPTTLEIHTRRLKAYKDENGNSADGGEVQTDLFGNDDSAMLEMVKISKAAGELVKENKQKILAVKGVVKRPQVAKEMGVDINDPEAVKAAIAQLEYENQRLMSPTPEPEILHKIKVRAGLETEESQVAETDGDAMLQDDSLDLELAASGGMEAKPGKKLGKFLNKLEARILEFMNELKNRRFNEEEQGIVSVINGDRNFYHIRLDDLGNIVAFLKGSRDKTGANHIMLKHFGQNAQMGYVSAEEILQIGEIIRNGALNIVNENERRYTVEDPDLKGRKLTVVVKKSFKKAQPDFVFTFYSNKKAEEVRAQKQALGQPPSDLSSSTVDKASDNSAQSQGKKSENISGGIEAKQAESSADISEPFDTAGAAEADYRKISELAQREFKAKPALLSRIISKSRSILPRTVKFDKNTNRLSGVPSIADIRRYAERAFAVPIAAKMRRDNPKFLGVYLSDLQAIRTRGGHTNDIGILAHELGHHLETILFARKLSETETAASQELADYCVERFGDNAYPESEHVSEGFAQFISDVITDVNDARARCPQAYALFERALRDNSNAAAAFDNIRQMVALNKNASAFDRVQANIRRASDMEKTPFMEKIKGLHRLYRRKLIDSNEGIAELAQEIDRQSPGKGKKFLDMVTNYQGGHIGQSEYSIKNQQLDIDGNVVGKGLEQIISDNLGAAFDRENFSAYLYARRAVEYFNTAERADETQMCRRLFGIQYDDAKQIVEQASANMRRTAKDVDGYILNDLRLLKDAGVVSLEDFNRLKENKGYAPLRRYMESLGESVGGGSGGGVANTFNPIKGFKGSDREVIDPIDSIIENSYRFREIALKNRICKNVIGGIQNGIALGDWATPYPEQSRRFALKTREYAEAILDSGLYGKTERDADAKKLTGKRRAAAIAKIEAQLKRDPMAKVYIYREEAVSDAKNQVVTYFANGKKVAWQVHDKGLFEALNGLDALSAKFFNTIVGKWISAPARTIRATATSTLNFVGANFIRDNQAAFMYSNNGFVPLWSPLRYGVLPAIVGNFGKRGGFLRSLAESAAQTYDEWLANGGKFSNQVQEGGRTYAELTADDIMREQSFKAHVLAWLEKCKRAPVSTVARTVIAPFEKFSSLSEESTRLAEFALAKKNFLKKNSEAAWRANPYARRDAANQSKSVSLNFARAGQWGRNINVVVPFFNAAMQGLDKVFTELNPVDFPKLLCALRDFSREDLKDSLKADNASKLMKCIAIGSILGTLELSLSSEDTDDLPDWRKLRFWNFDLGGLIISIPKNQEVATLVSEVFSRAVVSWQTGELDIRAGDYAKTVNEILLPSVIPQFIKPFVENMTNYSFFKQGPIESRAQQSVIKSMRASATTSTTAKWIAQNAAQIGVELSPVQLDNLNQGFFAGLGTFGVKFFSDPLLEAVSSMPERPEVRLREWPLVSAFTVNPYAPSVYVQKFFEAANDCDMLLQSAKQVGDGRAANTFSPEQLRRANWYNAEINGVKRATQIRRVRTEMSELNKATMVLRNSNEYSPEQKRKMMLSITRAKNDLAKRTYQELAFDEQKYKAWKEE